MREQLLAAERVKAIDWRDGALHLLDQRALPFAQTWLSYHSVADVAEAIRSMVVRGLRGDVPQVWSSETGVHTS